jgi:hypothetical protein
VITHWELWAARIVALFSGCHRSQDRGNHSPVLDSPDSLKPYRLEACGELDSFSPTTP